MRQSWWQRLRESFTIVDNREMPEIGLQHLLAAMLVDGCMDFHSAHDRARMQDPAVLQVRKLIQLDGDNALSKAVAVRQGIVALTLGDRTELFEHTKAVRGTPPNPITREEVQDKAMSLLEPVLGNAAAIALCEGVWNIDRFADSRAFTALMRADG